GQLVEPTGELQYDAIYTRKLLNAFTQIANKYNGGTNNTTYGGKLELAYDAFYKVLDNHE
ncbi:hypothetical protein, partial [Deinococcus piscis]|uniref:hypothetical protein n=1 Tax=Deinococcus piscis TaxID=394230 RepID=UPI001E3DD40B